MTPPTVEERIREIEKLMGDFHPKSELVNRVNWLLAQLKASREALRIAEDTMAPMHGSREPLAVYQLSLGHALNRVRAALGEESQESTETVTVGPGRQSQEHDNEAVSVEQAEGEVSSNESGHQVNPGDAESRPAASPSPSPQSAVDIQLNCALVPWCPQCGPEPRVDGDGCCAVCGCDCGEVPDWRPIKEAAKLLRRERDEALAERDDIRAFHETCGELLGRRHEENDRLCEERDALAAKVHELEQEGVANAIRQANECTRHTEGWRSRAFAAEQRLREAEVALRKIDNGECPLVPNAYGYRADPPDCRIITAAYFAAAQSQPGREKCAACTADDDVTGPHSRWCPLYAGAAKAEKAGGEEG